MCDVKTRNINNVKDKSFFVCLAFQGFQSQTIRVFLSH